MMHSGLRLDI